MGDGVGCKCGWPLDSCAPELYGDHPCGKVEHEKAQAEEHLGPVLTIELHQKEVENVVQALDVYSGAFPRPYVEAALKKLKKALDA